MVLPRYFLLVFTGRFQPEMVICFAREMVNSPAGASLVKVVPAPSVAPLRTVGRIQSFHLQAHRTAKHWLVTIRGHT